MSNPISEYSRVAGTVTYLASQITAEGLIAASSALEAGFYGSLKLNSTDDYKAVKWIRKFAVEHIRAIQTLFNTVNAAASLYYAKRLLTLAETRFNFSASAIISLPFKLLLKHPYLAGPSILAASAVLTGGLLLYFRLTRTPEKEIPPGQIVVSEGKSTAQQFAKFFHTTKLVCNCVLLALSKGSPAQTVDLPGTLYSILQNSQIKWIHFTQIQKCPRPVDVDLNGYIQKIKATYNMLQLPANPKIDNSEGCGICYESNRVLESALCANHIFCRSCLEAEVKNKNKTILDGARYTLFETKHYTNNAPTHTTYSYQSTLQEGQMPRCPLLCEIPLQNYCDLSITNSTRGTLTTHPDVEGDVSKKSHKQSAQLLAQLSATYSIVQAGLAYLQTYPQLAASIYKIQCVMGVVDCFALLGTGIALSTRVTKKWGVNLKKSMSARIGLIAAVIGTGAISHFSMLQINAYLKSAIILKDVLSKLPIDADQLKNISASWNAPFSHQTLQCLFLSRIATSVASAYFAKNRQMHFLAAAAQMFALAGLSSLRWIEFQQTFNWPLKTFINQGAILSENVKPNSIRELIVASQFLVSRFQAIDATRLQAQLQAIYNFTQKAFENSSWNSFWAWHQVGNVSYYLPHYAIRLQNNVMEIASHLVPPHFWGRTLSIWDRTEGRAIAQIL